MLNIYVLNFNVYKNIFKLSLPTFIFMWLVFWVGKVLQSYVLSFSGIKCSMDGTLARKWDRRIHFNKSSYSKF